MKYYFLLFAFLISSAVVRPSIAFDLMSFFGFDLDKEESLDDMSNKANEDKVSTLDEDTPLAQKEVAGGVSLTASRPFRAPEYAGQEKALGYDENIFIIPKGMENQVAFWRTVYSKYTTDQGVLHDTENLNIVYMDIDFKDFNVDQNLSYRRRERRKQKFVDEKKKEIQQILLKLDKVGSEEGLNDLELKIWRMFQGINEPNKFKEAAQKGRIRFQLGQRDRMQSAIFFSGRYLEDMERIFREAGLPIELVRLVFVESSFNVLARSKVGASGLWQIMRNTARPYKMVSKAVDLRNHPLSATKLAAQLMKDNYNLLRDWPLAITGYNHGPTGVRKLTEKYKTREIVELVQNVSSRRSFGFASRNFYACFLAVLEIEKNANTYFQKVVWSKPLGLEEIKIPISVTYKDLLTWFDGDDQKAQVFNPHINKYSSRKAISIPAKTIIAIPKDRYDQALISLARGTFVYAKNFGPNLKGPSENSGPELKSGDSSR